MIRDFSTLSQLSGTVTPGMVGRAAWLISRMAAMGITTSLENLGKGPMVS